MKMDVESVKNTHIDWCPRPAMASFVRAHRPDICKSKNPYMVRFVSLVNFLAAFPDLKRDDPWLTELLDATSPPMRKRGREISEEGEQSPLPVHPIFDQEAFTQEMRNIVREEVKRAMTEEYREQVRAECTRELMEEHRFRLFSLMDQLQNAWPLNSNLLK
jgi:hypothetical protein